MTIKEAILKSLEELKELSTHTQVYNHLIENKYYVSSFTTLWLPNFKYIKAID